MTFTFHGCLIKERFAVDLGFASDDLLKDFLNVEANAAIADLLMPDQSLGIDE